MLWEEAESMRRKIQNYEIKSWIYDIRSHNMRKEEDTMGLEMEIYEKKSQSCGKKSKLCN